MWDQSEAASDATAQERLGDETGVNASRTGLSAKQREREGASCDNNGDGTIAAILSAGSVYSSPADSLSADGPGGSCSSSRK